MVQIAIRCTPELKAELEKRARAERRKLSDWLRLELELLVRKKRSKP